MSDSSFTQRIETLYREESRRIFASLAKRFGDLDLAEEALADAFQAAMQQWPREGFPQNPCAWLILTGRNKAIDRLRRRTRESQWLEAFTQKPEPPEDPKDLLAIEDDQLALIFTCCHPAIAFELQVALTLREVCGLTTTMIADAFLVSTTTMAQRLVRGKAKIKLAKIPFRIPEKTELPERLESVLAVLYLIFNEGYYASEGESLTRPDLSGEAIRLAELLVKHLPDAEAYGLLALMLFQESRRSSRLSASGDLILLEHQDRTLWNRTQIAQGDALLQRAYDTGEIGSFTLEASIAALHSGASSFQETPWSEIVQLYQVLYQVTRSPVVALNRAVAVAMAQGPEAGLALMEQLQTEAAMAHYHLLPAAQADLYRRLGRMEEAAHAYEKAIALAKLEPEKRFLTKQLKKLK